jgi:hypothetical protein
MAGLQRYKKSVVVEMRAVDGLDGVGKWEFWANIPLCGVSFPVLFFLTTQPHIS